MTGILQKRRPRRVYTISVSHSTYASIARLAAAHRKTNAAIIGELASVWREMDRREEHQALSEITTNRKTL